MKRNWVFTLTTAASILMLSACGSGNETTDESNVGSSGMSSEVLSSTGTNTDNGSKEVLVYSNSLAGGRQEWIDEKATEAGFEMQFVEAGGGEVLNRLLAESSSPQADVAFGMDEAMFFELKDEDLLVEFEPGWISDFAKEANVGEM